MNYNKRYKISRVISDLRNGFCVCLVKNASKTLFFCKNTIHPEVLANIQNYTIVTSKEYFNFNYNGNVTDNVILSKNYLFQNNADASDNLAIQLAKVAELQPVLIRIQGIEPPTPCEEINVDDIDYDITNFQYEVSFLAKSKIQLVKAQNAEIYAFGSKFGGHEHYAILINNPLDKEYPFVRIHSSCYTGDLLASLRCDCRDQLQESISFMNKTSGILLYIMQEGRGIGLANKIKAYNLQQEEGLDTVESNLALGFQDDERSFVPAFKILEFFQKTSIRLITNNPKKVDDLSLFNINVVETIPTYLNPNEHNQGYLQVKKDKMGHTINV